ncbi:hypothetical protein LPB72_03420 [Hydrogenophaga crassostreae]|uniref:HTH cro/C1-type domain-containing protein n=1 Tax=Hydrogenophaga crassostreae TaxID=1763535 RepID=A0A163CM56_9BURK|nr:hypothetical protein LPB072_17615 [Hydrogenophaga crassostreae]OAD43592.1 hypothetical protein LPB72_03420 [Hydrogenophaga crassostreae]
MLPLLSLQLKARREARGLGQEDAAKLFGVDKDTVSRWERGRSKPGSASVLAAIKAEYAVSQKDLDDWFFEWTIRELKEGDRYFIRGNDYLAASGIDESGLLAQLVDIDFDLVPNMSTLEEGTIEQWAPIFQASPSTWKLLTHGNKIVGYWHYLNLKDEYFDLVKIGQLRDSQITPEMLDHPTFLEPGKSFKLYMVMIGIHSTHRFMGAGGKLINSFLMELERTASQGILFSEFATVAHTHSGEALCRDFGMEKIGHHASHTKAAPAEIFHTTGSNVSKTSPLKIRQKIAQMYSERFPQAPSS